MGLNGWVCNSSGGVTIEAEGTEERLAHFIRRIRAEAPPLAQIASLKHSAIPDTGDDGDFTIRESDSVSGTAIRIAPDAAVCPECLRELTDRSDRRYGYPFITCTDCGPRYSIITAAPYDRPNTTMAAFPLCPACEMEYHDPGDRRFHAQPIGCHDCGPRLEMLGGDGSVLGCDEKALTLARHALKEGKILGVKGIGGFHLAVDARDQQAVQRLRDRKQRDEKPFAVMVADLQTARSLAEIDPLEERLLASSEAPIVLVRNRKDTPLAAGIAPGNGWLGLMLPYTPLHHLLLSPELPALVMTSANRSDEPISYRDDFVVEQLAGIVDGILTHNRPIHTPQDDSVIRVFQGRPLFYRRARGYVPRAVPLPFATGPLLAVGAELKNTFCLAEDNQAVLSQHLGDLKSEATFDSFRSLTGHLGELLNIAPRTVACDHHPDFLSTLHAESLQLPLTRVQHHHAHLAACMAENGLTGPVIGIIFDGTGYGTDGTVWGGEFLIGDYDRFQRAGHFLPVRLPGGDRAVQEPWRMALSLLYCTLGETAFHLKHPVVDHLSAMERPIFIAMLEQGFNAPLTSSCGRLIDAAAALLGVRNTVSYDGQAAIELEALAETADTAGPLPYRLITGHDDPLQIDFSPMFPAMLASLEEGVPRAALAGSVHETIARASVEACMHLSRETGVRQAVLSGGVFQNRLLTEMIHTGLSQEGLQVFCHRLVPPNDGCIALGQAAIAGWQTRRNN